MKILIIGNVGSGKTTLGNNLAKLYGIKLFSIDNIVYDDENKLKREELEQINLLNKINRENKEYIIEGVLHKNMDFLLNLVDKVVIIDLDKKILKNRIRKRYIKQKIGISKDKYLVSKVHLYDMYNWIEKYDYDRINKLIIKYSRKIVYLKTTKDINKYLKAVKKELFLL